MTAEPYADTETHAMTSWILMSFSLSLRKGSFFLIGFCAFALGCKEHAERSANLPTTSSTDRPASELINPQPARIEDYVSELESSTEQLAASGLQPKGIIFYGFEKPEGLELTGLFARLFGRFFKQTAPPPPVKVSGIQPLPMRARVTAETAPPLPQPKSALKKKTDAPAATPSQNIRWKSDLEEVRPSPKNDPDEFRFIPGDIGSLRTNLRDAEPGEHIIYTNRPLTTGTSRGTLDLGNGKRAELAPHLVQNPRTGRDMLDTRNRLYIYTVTIP